MFAAAIFVGLYAKYIRSFRNYFLLALVLSLVFPASARYWQEYVIEAAGYFTSSMLLWLLVAKLAKENIAAYFITACVGNMVASLRILIAHGKPQYMDDIITLTVVALIPLGYVLYASLNTATREVEEAAESEGQADSPATKADSRETENTSEDG